VTLWSCGFVSLKEEKVEGNPSEMDVTDINQNSGLRKLIFLIPCVYVFYIFFINGIFTIYSRLYGVISKCVLRRCLE
jgi:hypothetical protein